jgi:hypothetical protein
MGCMIHTVGNGEDRYGFDVYRCPTRMSTDIELMSHACMSASWRVLSCQESTTLDGIFSRCRRDHARNATIRLFREASQNGIGHIDFYYEQPSQPQPKLGTILRDVPSNKPPITKKASQASPSSPRSLADRFLSALDVELIRGVGRRHGLGVDARCQTCVLLCAKTPATL